MTSNNEEIKHIEITRKQYRTETVPIHETPVSQKRITHQVKSFADLLGQAYESGRLQKRPYHPRAL